MLLRTGRLYIRHEVAKCSRFVPVPATANLGPLPAFPAPASTIQVISGSASIFYYLDGKSSGARRSWLGRGLALRGNG